MHLWLAAGVLLALAELHFTGIGLFFAGLGAIATGTALHLGLADATDYLAQWLIFFIATGVFALLLWKPLQRFSRPAPGYNNMIGDTAYVGSQGLGKHGGEVTWSGTIMKAQLVKHASVETLAGGAPVTIVDVKGATLIVKPKE